jgi:3-hydroxyacyl-CoA dehydrogenase/enoyl-CoA hydratase/3-hydroxybutyryl-CoA epimerase
MTDRPTLAQFRIEDARDGLIHLVFDMPDRSMNVFSNAAIHELGAFSAWLKASDVRGVVVRSGKGNAFCAGADLGELGVAYDMIVAARPQDRFDIGFDHFFPLSRAIRALETSGKPVAVAIAGLALGGGCELALGGHYRVLVDDPAVAMGLPESLVGLLPGAGGTQRMPRLVGVEAALPILLEGARLAGNAAVAAGLANELVAPGEDVAAAERWLLAVGDPVQPWDRPDHVPASHADIAVPIDAKRAAILAETLGHYPAPLAILDCIEQGFVQSFDAAIRTEMSIFAHLIQRPEPRNMIQTMFLGKTDYERAMRKDALSEPVKAAIAELTEAIGGLGADAGVLASAGFGKAGAAMGPVQSRVGSGYWIDTATDPRAGVAKRALESIADQAERLSATLSPQERRMADYALVTGVGFPAYLGGPFAFSQAIAKEMATAC